MLTQSSFRGATTTSYPTTREGNDTETGTKMIKSLRIEKLDPNQTNQWINYSQFKTKKLVNRLPARALNDSECPREKLGRSLAEWSSEIKDSFCRGITTRNDPTRNSTTRPEKNTSLLEDSIVVF